jgi:hypothetical protein
LLRPPASANVGAVLDLAQAVDRTAPDARSRAADLFAADDMPSQVAGLALLAGQGWLDAQTDWTRVAPETALAAVDLCGALFGAEPADGLLEQWMAGAGGAQAAGEAAIGCCWNRACPAAAVPRRWT